MVEIFSFAKHWPYNCVHSLHFKIMVRKLYECVVIFTTLTPVIFYAYSLTVNDHSAKKYTTNFRVLICPALNL